MSNFYDILFGSSKKTEREKGEKKNERKERNEKGFAREQPEHSLQSLSDTLMRHQGGLNA